MYLVQLWAKDQTFYGAYHYQFNFRGKNSWSQWKDVNSTVFEGEE